MIEFEQALNIILNYAHSLDAEEIPVEESIGRILNEDINSKIEMPPFNKSAVDGYAVRSKDINKIPVKLNCIGLIQAGQTFKKKVKPGECVKIMTGAPMPDDTDSVVMVEYTKQSENIVEIQKQVKKLGNVCLKGEDILKNTKVLNKGIHLTPSHIAIISCVGKKSVKVIKKSAIAVLNTGGEIVPPGMKLSKNKIYNSNGPMLSALLNADNIPYKFLGIAKDNEKELKTAIHKGLEYDIFLISGGVSMGDYDIVPDILKKMGIRKKFHNVCMKPGKPLYFGVKNRTLVFGIPGNPVSNFLAYYLFIQPVLKKMMGYKTSKPVFHEGILQKEYRQKTGRKHFVLVKIQKKQNLYHIFPVKSHGSADVRALSKADGFMVVDKNIPLLKEKSKVKFITWEKI